MDQEQKNRDVRPPREGMEDVIAQRTAELKKANESLRVEVEERGRAEEALRASEQRYRQLLQVVPTYTYSVHLRNGIPISTDHSPGCQVVTGYAPEDYTTNAQLWIAMVHPDDRERVSQFVSHDLASRDPAPIEHRIVHKNGTIRWVRNTVVRHVDTSGVFVRYDGLVEDITERKLAEHALRETERLKAIGNLAGGVAHNFNSIMTLIGGYAYSIADAVVPSTRAHEEALHIIEAAKHAADLTRRLLRVARACDSGTDTALETVSIQKTLVDTIELLEHTLAERNVTVVNRCPKTDVYVRANPGQLLDCLMNLFLNATDAMPSGGTITVDLSDRRLSHQGRKGQGPTKAGPFAVFRIRDTGVGMSRQVLAHIFDPFFTTKAAISAFGLGLCITRNFVRNWGGCISVRSREGRGSSFRVFIPKAVEAPPSGVVATPAAKDQTILLIDDNPHTLAMMRATLEKAGYRVHAADTAEIGMRIYQSHKNDIGVSVIDMIMPGADWPPTLANLIREDPHPRLVLTSGFPRDYARREMPVGTWSFLQKPFEAEKLLEIVETVTARNPSADNVRHSSLTVT